MTALAAVKPTQPTRRPKLKRWTEQEVAVLRRYYPTRGARFCAEKLPRRSPLDVRDKAHRLRIKSVRNPREWVRGAWTREEISLLETTFVKSGALGCLELLPHRSIGAIKTKAAHLKLRAPFRLTVQRLWAVADQEGIRRLCPRLWDSPWLPASKSEIPPTLLSDVLAEKPTPQEAIIARELLDREFVERQRLVRALYAARSDGGALLAEGVIKLIVHRLRKKLRKQYAIVTDWSRGYAFIYESTAQDRVRDAA